DVRPDALAQLHQVMPRERVDHRDVGRARGAGLGERLVEVPRIERVHAGAGKGAGRIQGRRHASTLGQFYPLSAWHKVENLAAVTRRVARAGVRRRGVVAPVRVASRAVDETAASLSPSGAGP